MSMTIYIYGTEVHDNYQAISYARTEQAAWEEAEDIGYGSGWISQPIACIDDCKGDAVYERIYRFAEEQLIADQIVEALARKHRARDAYKAPSLADLWPKPS